MVRMKQMVFLMMVLMGTAQWAYAAPDKRQADEAYQQEDFAAAIGQYEELLATQGESSVVYYNLGNSYFKAKNIAKAIFNYERALLLNPGDADTRFNLEMAKSKAVDQIVPTPEVFIVTWVNALVNARSERAWSTTAIVSFLLVLVGAALYLFGNRIWIRKVGFVGTLVLLVVCVCANSFAGRQKSKLLHRNGAIVMAPSITVKSTPNESGTDLFVLHEGAKVFVEDNSMKEWKEVRLEDGKKGWLPVSAIEGI